MQPIYVRCMGLLYRVCILIAVFAMIGTTILVFAGVVGRFFGFGAMYSEQLSIMLAIQMAFYGGTACYRAHSHLALTLFVSLMPKIWQLVIRYFVIVLFILVSGSMMYWGADLVKTTMFQHYAEFPAEWLKVGYIYSAVPVSGGILMLFAIEQLLYRSTDEFHGDEGDHDTEMDIIRKAQEGKA